mmetsp:Transcript_150712/g.420101  ORF Transcript_150712/g.420101 Transcript_150712/m.420101 type:complete len:80 (-) Transcript_150712:570-809(-)
MCPAVEKTTAVTPRVDVEETMAVPLPVAAPEGPKALEEVVCRLVQEDLEEMTAVCVMTATSDSPGDTPSNTAASFQCSK